MVTAKQLDDMERMAKGMAYVKHGEWDRKDLMRNLLRILVEMDYYDVVESGVSEATKLAIFRFQKELREIESKYLYSKYLDNEQ